MGYALKSPEDEAKHQERHRLLAFGGIPSDVSEFLKEVGWNVAHRSPVEQGVSTDSIDPDTGKRAVLFGWWGRARLYGIGADQFDQFMEDQLHFIDAMTSENRNKIAKTSAKKKQWDRYVDGPVNSLTSNS